MSGSSVRWLAGMMRCRAQLLHARLDVVTPRTLRDDVRAAALAEAVPLGVGVRFCASATSATP
jgi:hypothetical protein